MAQLYAALTAISDDLGEVHFIAVYLALIISIILMFLFFFRYNSQRMASHTLWVYFTLSFWITLSQERLRHHGLHQSSSVSHFVQVIDTKCVKLLRPIGLI